MPNQGRFNPDNGESSDPTYEDDRQSEGSTSESTPKDPPAAPAGFWLRAWAAIIDYVIIASVVRASSLFGQLSIIYDSITALLAPYKLRSFELLFLSSIALALTLLLILLLLQIFYGALFESSPLAATPGKWVLGLFVTDEQGGACSISRAFVRNTFKLLSAAVLFVGFITPAFSVRKQTWHDIISGTLVMRKPNLKPQQSYFGAALALSLVVLHISWEDSPLIPPRKPPEQVSFKPLPAPRPSSTPLPPSSVMSPQGEAFGVIRVNDQSYDLKGAYVRLRKATVAFDQNVFDRRAEFSPRIEVALFLEELSEEEHSQLSTLPSMINDAGRVIKKQPVLELMLGFNEQMQFCEADGLLYGHLDFNRTALTDEAEAPPSIVPLSFPFQSMRSAGRLIVFCPRMEEGQELTLSFDGEGQVSGDPDLSLAWNVKFRSLMGRFTTLGAQRFESQEEPVALWFPSKGILQLGFFSEPLSFSRREALVSSGDLTTVQKDPPDLVVVMPLPPNTSQVNRERADAGYQILIYNKQGGGIKLPGDPPQFSIDIPRGVLPKTLYGSLTGNKRLVGRIDGSKNLLFEKGIFEFSWLLLFNTPVHVVR
ncbi:MAG: RDD family protein [Deltaproteobacteria bacterium]|nr:RDD family protein [Deltaproteobacteria bacterium]